MRKKGDSLEKEITQDTLPGTHRREIKEKENISPG